MDGCERIEENGKCADDEISWKPFLRQLLICSGVWTAYFTFGLIAGAPTVFIPQIRKEANNTEVLSDEMVSWLSSAYSFSGFFCIVILSFTSKFFGRKIAFMVACIDTFIAFLIFFCSTSVIQILISEIMQGLFSAAQITVSFMILTEYTSPKYRGLFLTIKTATSSWGTGTANLIGTYFHWKKIGLLGIICAMYTLATILIWPESPYWLASKGRYKECATSHRWLKGCNNESEKELETLIIAQKEYVKGCRREKISKSVIVRYWYTMITSKQFYKPTLISILAGYLSIFSGKFVFTVYAIDIIKKITDSESTAYTAMLILDGITIASMYLGCVLSKFLKRRVLLLVASSISVIFLYIISLYLYLIHLSVISENKYVSVCLLACFSIAVNCGPIIMSVALFGELLPVRSRNLASCVTALVGKITLSVVIKTAPYIFKTFGLHGTFFSFGITCSICICLLYLYLPETKDKTLQEIANSIIGATTQNKKSLKEIAMLTKRN